MNFKLGDKVKFYFSVPSLKRTKDDYETIRDPQWHEGYLEYVRASEYDWPGLVEIITEDGSVHKFWPPYEAVMTMRKL
jgi:hypothetical protein